MTDTMQQQADEFRQRYAALKEQIGKVIVGHDEIVHSVLTCLFVGGHCLLEGVPGLGKTLLVRTLAKALELDFSRIQFTPDLMPADILGTNMVVETPEGRKAFEFQKGPIFTQICLADEINRATPKTQSALLETMQEGTVTVGGQRFELKKPFLVMATQNPIEQEGTYPLPEAQLDRFFFKVVVGYSTREQLATIVERTTRSEHVEADKVMDGAENHEMARPRAERDSGRSRSGFPRACHPGDASRRTLCTGDHQPVHPLGIQSPRSANAGVGRKSQGAARWSLQRELRGHSTRLPARHAASHRAKF